MTYLDLHCHSVASDDSRATVEQYLKWINVLRKRGFTVDGIVLTEHRQFNFDADYSQLAAEYGVIVLKGAELDTCFGHMLVYNITPGLYQDIDFGNVRMDGRELIKAARHHGGYVVPAHPGRFGIGLVEYMEQGEQFPGVSIVERLNAGGKPEENQRAEELCQRTGYLGTGGSDAHLASHICRVVTEFQATVSTSEQLVDALIFRRISPRFNRRNRRCYRQLIQHPWSLSQCLLKLTTNTITPSTASSTNRVPSTLPRR